MNTADPRASLVEAAVQHLASRAPSDRALVVLMSVGGGEASAALAAQLRHSLESRVRVVFASAAVTPGGPMPTPQPGEHVQSVQSAVTPWPDRVVRVSVSESASSIAVRLPGRDPLGPAEGGWEWFETRP